MADEDSSGSADTAARDGPDPDHAGNRSASDPAHTGNGAGSASDRPDPDGEEPNHPGSESEPADDGPTAILAQLGVREHAKLGLIVATAITAVLYSPFVLRLAIDGRDELLPAINFLSLAFVLWFSIAFTVAVLLTARAGLRPVLDHEGWLRRGGAVAVLGGVGWALLPVLALLAAAGWRTVGIDTAQVVPVWQVVAIGSPLLVLVGATTVHAAVKTAAGRLEAGGYLVVMVGLAIASANATGMPFPTTTVGNTIIASPFLLGVFVALTGTVAFAAGADLTGRLPSKPLLGLLAASLAGVLSVAALFALDLVAVLPANSANTVVLALVTYPAGMAWIAVGMTLRRNADAVIAAAPPGAPSRLGATEERHQTESSEESAAD